jgi:2-octaprenyl-6-methoxyphenol hydroxylase
MTNESPQILVTGSGPVSLACALFLVRRGVAPARVGFGRAAAAGDPVPAALAARALAISHGSRQLLDRIAAFPAAGRIAGVDVSLAGHAGRTRIAATDLGVPALGHVVRYGALVQALHEAAARLPWAAPDDGAAVRIHADGDPGDDADTRAFDQSALLGEVLAPESGEQAAAIAYERFTDAGPLALLPLPEPRRRALVWCDTDARCAARLALPREALEAALRERFGPALGPLRIDGPLSVAPLARRMRRRLEAPGEVWIGNAAQTLHPVAGQGLNLGLRDAFELAAALADAGRSGASLRVALAAYRRSRGADRTLTVALTDLMAGSFTWPLARPLQSPLLAALDMVPALRRPLAVQLMFGLR